MAPKNGDCNANVCCFCPFQFFLVNSPAVPLVQVFATPPIFLVQIFAITALFCFGLAEGQTFSETESGHGLRSLSSSVWSISTSHVTVRAAEGDDVLAVQEGEGEEKGSARSLQSLGLVSEADLLRKKAKKPGLRRKRLVRKRQLRKRGVGLPLNWQRIRMNSRKEMA